MSETILNIPVDDLAVSVYFKSLVDRFFKILPMWERGEDSLPTYMQSLQVELLGCHRFIPALSEDSNFLALLAVLQYFINTPDCDIGSVRREVFGSITLCNRLSEKFAREEDVAK